MECNITPFVFTRMECTKIAGNELGIELGIVLGIGLWGLGLGLGLKHLVK